MPELKINGLAKRFGSNWGVRDVNLNVTDGEFFTLLGPSGCGKSTTLACVAGLETPDAGSIEVGGVAFYDEEQRRVVPPEDRGCGLVFQTYALWPHMTVYENLEFPLKLRRNRQDVVEQRRDRIMEVLELVELVGYEKRYPHELSGGQQQRVALGRAVVYRPRILLLDEPLSNLDAKLRERARGWVKRLQRETGITTLYVTHDQDEALALSDRIAVMREGVIVQMGTPEEIYSHPEEAFVADFVGRSNFLEGTVTGTVAEFMRVKVAGFESDVRASVPASQQRFETGSSVVLAVRPERVTVVDDADPTRDSSGNIAKAAVVERSYLGSSYEYEVRVGDSTLWLETSERYEATRLVLSIEPESFIAYPVGARELVLASE